MGGKLLDSSRPLRRLARRPAFARSPSRRQRRQYDHDAADAELNHELSYQTKRGLMHFARNVFKPEIAGERLIMDNMVNGGVYVIGEPDEVADRLKAFHRNSGGFGALLIVAGKQWADRDRRHKSMRLFMDEVAPTLRDLGAEA